MTDGDFHRMEERLKDAFRGERDGNGNNGWSPLQ